MLLKIFKNRTVSSSGTWGTKNENNYEILNFEFPEELEEYNKRIVYYLGNQKVWDAIIDNKAILTNAITTKGSVKAYIWCTKSDEAFETDVDFRTQIFVMNFFENDNADGIVPTPEQVDGFNTMLTAMNKKIEEIDELETTIENAETQRQENEETRQENESTRQDNEQTRQEQEAERERRTDEAIGEIEDLTEEYNQNAQEKTNAFNQNATNKTNDFNDNASSKKSDFNSNAESKTTTFNNNASSKTSDFNTNATNKTNAFDSNASSKTTTFNNNVTSKTTDFNTNAENKTTAFNSNATDKTTNFDNNASSKTTTFNENATSKTNDFNDNATAKTTAFNDNAQAKTEAFDEHTAEITADIEDLQQEVEELSENMPWNETEQGTYLDITDAAKYSKNKMKVFGNTEQTQYSGKNFFHVNNSSAGWGTLTFALVNNIINISIGDGNGGLGQSAQGDYTDYNFDTSKDYYFSLYQKEGDLRFKESATSKWFRAVIYIKYSDDTTSSNHISITTGMQSKNEKITFTEGKTPVAFAIGRYSPSGTLENNQSAQYYVQLEQGDTATAYEPYVGGVPSPNPDYPQDIHVVSGENTITLTSNNLFDKNNYNIKSLNASSSQGTSTYGSATNQKHIYIPCKPNTDYVVIKDVSFISFLGVFESPSVPAVGVTYTTLYFSSSSSGRVHVKTGATAQYLDVRINTDTITQYAIDRIADTLFIAEGTDINMSYQPYYYRNFTIDLGNIELCKIGGKQDYLYKENGNWYKYEAINKYVYNDDLTYNATSEDYISVLTPVINIGILSQSQLRDISYCNMFTTYFINNTGFNGTTNSHKIRINISFSYATTFAEVKTLCEEKSLLIYYGAETPTSTQITDETLISQLEAIYNHLALVKGTNHITITPSDLAPYMKLNYMQDLPSKLNNLDSRLSLLE